MFAVYVWILFGVCSWVAVNSSWVLDGRPCITPAPPKSYWIAPTRWHMNFKEEWEGAGLEEGGQAGLFGGGV